MLQTATDFSLEQIINIVNQPVLPPILIRGRPNSISEKKESPMRFLSFKPWSGKDDSPRIRQQIQGEEEESGQDEECLIEVPVRTEASVNEVDYSYRFQNGAIKLIKKLLDENGFRCQVAGRKDWTIHWSSSVVKMETYQALLPYQKINHFPNSFHITRKDLMNKCISKMQIKYGGSHFNFLPKTFILPQQMALLKQDVLKEGSTYIVKPHNRSQGKGITVTTSLETILNKLEKYSSVVVSHYIGNPLLINGLKFDLRIYVAITGVNPLRIYVYEEGLARFATQTYDMSGVDCESKRYQHLTNYSVNKKNVKFIKADTDEYFGSKWSLSSLKGFLSYSIGNTQTNDLFARIDDVIVKTIISAENILFSAFHAHVPYSNSCFEVLGFDIMIDSALKPWLIEVNMSPSMNSDSPLDIKIKGSMIADVLNMTGVTPLAQRYQDGSHLRYESRNYSKPDRKNIEMGPIQRFVLKEVKAEYQRKGGWRRVFPERRYKMYFEVDRYFNRLLREYEDIQEGIQGRQEGRIETRPYLSVNARQSKPLSKVIRKPQITHESMCMEQPLLPKKSLSSAGKHRNNFSIKLKRVPRG